MLPIEEARSAIAAKDWLRAERLLKQEVEAPAPSAEVYYLHGLASFKLHKYADAQASLLRTIEFASDNAPACFYLAGCAVAASQPMQAVDWLRRYLVIVPDDADSWTRLGMILAETKKPADALEAFATALDIDPGLDEARWHTGLIHYRAREYEKAAVFLATINPGSPIGRRAYELGIHAAEQAGLWNTAIDIIRIFLQNWPEEGEKLRQLARFEFLANNTEASLAALGQLAAISEFTVSRLLTARVVTTETWELLASKWVQLHLKSEPVDETVRIRPSLTRHDRAQVISPEWLVLTEANDMLIEQMAHNPHTLHKTGPHVIALAADRCLLDLPEESIQIDDACILVGGSHDYYHWLVDSLPRIGIAHKIPALRDLKLLVNANLASWQIASLAALGIGLDRLQLVPDNVVAKCRALWVPTLLSRSGVVHSYVVGWLGLRFQSQDMKAKPARRLFLRHAGASESSLANEDELATVLQANGFEAIAPEAMDFMDQVAAFSVAEAIVSPSCPALANLLFAPAGATVIEIKPPWDRFVTYQSLSRRTGQNYLRVDGRLSAGSEQDGANQLYLDPSRLLDALAKCEARA